MSDYLLILISTALVNNFVLAKFLGLCPFFGSSQRMETAVGMALATMLVLTMSSAISYLLDRFFLQPLELSYLRALVFILVIASLVQFIEMLLHRINPLLHTMLGIFLPLITTNCAVLGVALLNAQTAPSFVHAVLSGFGAAVGFSLVLTVFAGLRKKIEYSAVPKSFQGTGIAMVTAGIMALAFMGFEGLAV